MTRSRVAHAAVLPLIVAAAGLLTGCSDIDWNWDLDWWKTPRRTVRPVRPTQSILKPAQTSSNQADVPNAAPAQTATTAPAAAEQIAELETPPLRDQSSQTPRPFRPLYLVSGGHAASGEHGEQRQKLRFVAARPCATVLEMLFVPLGRSGSADESYLMYEEPAEYEAAKSLVPMLDVPPLDHSTSTVGPEAALSAGLGHFYHIIGQGPIVDAALAEAAERRLAEVAQSSQFPSRERWAAAVLAGRIMTDYRYDYSSARSYFQQAEQLMPAGSLERMTARWWQADAWMQQGTRDQAVEIWRTILAEDGPRHPDSHIVRQARLRLEKKRKR